MRCKQCDLDHERVRELCKRSLFATARILCGTHIASEKPHKELCDFITDGLDSGKRHFLVLMPRGHLKTTLCTIAGTVWFLINDPERRILIVHASAKKAEEFLGTIRNVLMSDTFVHYFPELDPSTFKRGKMTQHEIDIPHLGIFPEASITSVGVTSTVTGGHYNVHIFDDLIDQTIAESVVELEKVHLFFQHSPPLFDTLSEGIRLVIGTRWAIGDLYGRIIEAGDHEVFDKYKECMINGVPIWPERFTADDFDSVRKTMSPRLFAAQYMNNPLTDDMIRFDESMFQYYRPGVSGKTIHIGDEEIPVSKLQRSMTVDPSLGETTGSDETGITVCGVDNLGRIFVLEAWAGRLVVPKLVDKIFEVYSRWRPQQVGIEDVAFQKALQYFIRREMPVRNMYFSIIPLKSGGKKKSLRIESLTPYFANKQVWMLPSQNKLRSQLLQFSPNSVMDYDDLIDSLAYQTQFWKAFSGPEPDPEALEDLTWMTNPDQAMTGPYHLVCKT